MHAPQSPCPHPSFTLSSPRSSRSTLSRVRHGSAIRVRAWPFTVRLNLDFSHSSLPPACDCSHRFSSAPPCLHFDHPAPVGRAGPDVGDRRALPRRGLRGCTDDRLVQDRSHQQRFGSGGPHRRRRHGAQRHPRLLDPAVARQRQPDRHTDYGDCHGLASAHLEERGERAGRGGGQDDPGEELAGRERGAARTAEEVGQRKPPLPAARRLEAHRGVVDKERGRRIGGGRGVAEVAGERAAVLNGRAADRGACEAERRVVCELRRAVGNQSVGHRRPDCDLTPRRHDPAQGQAAEVDQGFRAQGIRHAWRGPGRCLPPAAAHPRTRPACPAPRPACPGGNTSGSSSFQRQPPLPCGLGDLVVDRGPLGPGLQRRRVVRFVEGDAHRLRAKQVLVFGHCPADDLVGLLAAQPGRGPGDLAVPARLQPRAVVRHDAHRGADAQHRDAPHEEAVAAIAMHS